MDLEFLFKYITFYGAESKFGQLHASFDKNGALRVFTDSKNVVEITNKRLPVALSDIQQEILNRVIVISKLDKSNYKFVSKL